MPTSHPLSANPRPAHEFFESPYRSETSFKNFSAFLNKTLTVASRHSQGQARFSLLELLQTLNVPEAILKGSSVHRWKNETPPEDIDLQLPLQENDQKDQLLEQLHDFLMSRTGETQKTRQAFEQKIWFGKVTHALEGAWKRLIIHVGCSRANSSTLDLNFTNKPTLSHDTIHASKGIQFNWAKRKAFMVDSWHPSLVEWLGHNQLLWFNTDIDDGLARLSYRLCKAPKATLLQPALASQLVSQATQAGIDSIYLRVLQNEYPNSQLNTASRLAFWQPLIDQATSGNHPSLESEILSWSQFNTLAQLQQAIADPDTQHIVLDRLCKACQIGINFKNSIKHVLNAHSEIAQNARTQIPSAIGAELPAADRFFELIDQWPQIDEIPEHELQTVMGHYLQELAQSDEPTHAKRAAHMLGWLQGDAQASLHFWLDRLSPPQRANPPEFEKNQITSALVQVIKEQGVDGLRSAMPVLEQLGIASDDWRTVVCAIDQCKTPYEFTPPSSSPCISFDFLALLSRHSMVLRGMRPGATIELKQAEDPILTQGLCRQLLELSQRLHAEKIPVLLRSVVHAKPDSLDIELPDMALNVSLGQSTVTLTAGQRKHWLTEHAFGSLMPQAQGGTSTLHVLWKDGSMFSGKTSGSGHFSFNGTLSCIGTQNTPTGLRGLLQVGRDLCASVIPGIDLEHNHWAAKGLFNGHQLLKSSSLVEAAQSLKTGTLTDHTLTHGLYIEHDIRDHQPKLCKLHIPDPRGKTCLQLSYQISASALGPEVSQFENVWGVQPKVSEVQSHGVLHIAPYGPIQFKSALPWSVHQHAITGWGEVQGAGAVSFRWKGPVVGSQLLPLGSLYLDKQKIPAIVFDASDTSDPLPVNLLPHMADLLGKRLNGSYRFSPKIWNDNTQWPPAGFEGFVHQQQCGTGSFTGYLTSTGRAIGTLNQAGGSTKNHDTAWSGAFKVQNAAVLAQEAIGLDHQDQTSWGVVMSEQRILMPHGLVREHLINRDNQQAFARIERLYFCGQGMSHGRITQPSELVYDSPNLTRYLVGTGYSVKQNPKHLDIVVNAGDGGHDFMIIRPQHYDKQSKYQEDYRDAQGMHATWLVVDNQYRMGNIRFPSGLQYSGQIARRGNYFCMHGKGKLSVGETSFLTDIGSDLQILSVKGLNPESEHWLSLYTVNNQTPKFDLPQWIELLTNGKVDWHTDVQAHLLIRQLSHLKEQATVFSRL